MRIKADTIEAIDIDKVHVNGKEVKLVLEIDTEQGWACCYKTNENGLIECSITGLADTEMHYGKITFTKKEIK